MKTQRRAAVVKSWPTLPLATKYLLVAGAVACMGFALLYIGWIVLRMPDIKVESEAQSPNHKWVAIVRSELYGSIGGYADFAVSLRPLTGVLGSWREERVFEVYWNGLGEPPTARWLNARGLEIELHLQAGDIALQRVDYRDVVITYRQ